MKKVKLFRSCFGTSQPSREVVKKQYRELFFLNHLRKVAAMMPHPSPFLSLTTFVPCARYCPAQSLALHSLHCCLHCPPVRCPPHPARAPIPQAVPVPCVDVPSPHSGSSVPYHCPAPPCMDTFLFVPTCSFDMVEFLSQCFCQPCNFRNGQVWVRFISAKPVKVKNCL